MVLLFSRNESDAERLRALAYQIPPERTRCKDPYHGERRIFPSHEVHRKRNGKVGQEDNRKQYPEVLELWYEKAHITQHAGAEVNNR